MKFSESQLKAINHDTGPALILAVPGSGKTTVMLARINRLIENGIEPDKILSMTFSKSQAMDMENRFIKEYGDKKVYFSTIHSFTYGIIKSFYPNKVELIESNNRYNKYKIIQDMYFQLRNKKINDEQLEEFFSVSGYLKNTLMSYDDYKKKYSPAFNGFEKIYHQYENFKKSKNLIDFDDMLILALYILQNNKKALEFIQNKFTYIQVDEGQDTSFIQFKIISLISKPNNNLFIVADDDQSIYGFRGASSKELLNFRMNYPDAQLYYMQDNYRSTKSIIDVSNTLIKNNIDRYSKEIKHTKQNGNDINIVNVKNTRLQIEEILNYIQEDLKNNETVAIIYRNNISAIPFISEIDGKFPFFIKDSKFAFYSNQIIKDIIDIVNFSIDPYDINLFEKIYYKLNMFIKKEFLKEIKFMPENKTVIERLNECENLNNFFLDKFALLDYHISRLCNLDFDKAVKYIFYHMEYYEYLKEFSRRSTSSMISINRIIDTILQISNEIKTVSEFENKISRLIEIQKINSKQTQMVTFSTVHGSKGLEYDNVYMIDLIEKEFPAPVDNLTLKREFMEEERRLFYVGMTRAKNKLYLFYPEKLHNFDVKRSSFIDEILNKNKHNID